MTRGVAELFPNSATVDPQAPPDQRLKWENIPAKGAVCLLVAVEEQPLLLSTVGNLRAALQRRLSDVAADPNSPGGAAPTKRIPYGTITQRVVWREVHSAFSANWHYWNAARVLFPADYRERVNVRPPWWIGIDLSARFPRLIKTQNPTVEGGAFAYVGPVRDRAAATTLIETVEDLFDLCREYPILVQAPLGKACAYKEMGKCPAPCDGSIPKERYDTQLHAAWGFVTGTTRGAWLDSQQNLMKQAASELKFELAGKIKSRLTRAGIIHSAPYIWMVPLEDFAFVTLQRGEGRTRIEPWVIFAEGMRAMPAIQKKTLTLDSRALFESLTAAAKERPLRGTFDADQAAIASHFLFREKEGSPPFLRLTSVLSLGPEMLERAIEDRLLQKAEPEAILSAESHDDGSRSTPASEEAASAATLTELQK